MKLGILSLCGMGTDPKKYQSDLKDATKGLNVVHQEIDYHSNTQDNQDNFLKRMNEADTDWNALRKYAVNYLSDSLNMIRRGQDMGGMFCHINDCIDRDYNKLTAKLSDSDPIIIVAHSLGGVILLSYLFEHYHENKPFREIILPRIKAIITTGCPIALFYSCLPEKEIKLPPLLIRDLAQWYNFWDKDDILAWPLERLSPDFEKVVTDITINVGWTPIGHSYYWRNDRFQSYLQMIIKSALHFPMQ